MNPWEQTVEIALMTADRSSNGLCPNHHIRFAGNFIMSVLENRSREFKKCFGLPSQVRQSDGKIRR